MEDGKQKILNAVFAFLESNSRNAKSKRRRRNNLAETDRTVGAEGFHGARNLSTIQTPEMDKKGEAIERDLQGLEVQ